MKRFVMTVLMLSFLISLSYPASPQTKTCPARVEQNANDESERGFWADEKEGTQAADAEGMEEETPMESLQDTEEIGGDEDFSGDLGEPYDIDAGGSSENN